MSKWFMSEWMHTWTWMLEYLWMKLKARTKINAWMKVTEQIKINPW